MNWLSLRLYAFLTRHAIKRIDKRIECNKIGVNSALEIKDPVKAKEAEIFLQRGLKNIDVLMVSRARYEDFLANLYAGNVIGAPRFWNDDRVKGRRYSRFPL